MAESLPQETLAYFGVPDLDAYRKGLAGSSMGRILEEDEVQAFWTAILPYLEEGLASIKEQAAEEGVAVDDWKLEALTSFEMGIVADQEDGGFVGRATLDLGMEASTATGLFEWIASQAKEAGIPRTGDALHFSEGPLNASVSVSDGHLVLGIGDSGSWEGTGSFLDREDVQFGHQAIHEDGVLMYGFLDFQRYFSLLSTLMEEEGDLGGLAFGDLYGPYMDAFQGIHFGAGWTADGSSLTRSMAAFADGVDLSLFTAGPVDLDLVSFIPDDATSFSIGQAPIQAAFVQALSVFDQLGELEIEPASGTTFESALAEGGSAVHEWVFGNRRGDLDAAAASFGNQTFSWSKSSGNLMGGGGGGVTWMELLDPAPLRELFQELLPPLAELLKEEDFPVTLSSKRMKVRAKDKDGDTIVKEGPQYYLFKISGDILPAEIQLFASGLLAQFQPSFGITEDGWLVGSMGVGGVRAALRSGLREPKKNIRENPEASSFLDAAPATSTALSWSDPRPGLRSGIGMIKALTGLATGQMKDADPALGALIGKIPGPEPIVRNIRPSWSWTWMEDGNIHARSIGSLGVGEAIPGIAALGLGGLLLAEGFLGEVEPDENGYSSEHGESPAAPHASAERSAALAELARLQTGILVYEVTRESLPSSLAELVSEDDPAAFLADPKKGIRLDPWGNPFVFKVGDGDYTLFSMGPNGLEGGGDDVELD